MAIDTATSLSRMTHMQLAEFIANRKGIILSRIVSTPIVRPVVNHGRWLVNCPFCNGAELVNPMDTQFMCCSCMNEEVKHTWLSLQWPPNWKEIEAALLERKNPANRNYLPHETIEDILAQTLEREPQDPIFEGLL